MRRKFKNRLLLLTALFVLFDALGIQKMTDRAKLQRLNEKTAVSWQFRQQELNEELLQFLRNEKDRGKTVGLYMLESRFSFQRFAYAYKKEAFRELYRRWAVKKEWLPYVSACRAVWNDLVYFPVPESTVRKRLRVSFTDSWMNERTYGGKRGHEGTDVTASENEAGLYPVISMTDGVVTQKGWLEKGGYRIGITARGGAYFYYAHLDSYANKKVGDSVKAGDILGYMGDTGYGPEGTRGKFPVHLHVGIYIYDGEKEVSVNPYWILRYLEKHKLKYAYF